MPTRGQRIARAFGRRDDKLRSIFLAGECLKLYDVSTAPYTTPIATYDFHWYLDKHEYTELVSGKKYKLLRVQDVDGCRLEKLRKMTAVQIGGEVYKVVSKDSFVGSVPAYEFKLSSTGERV